MSVALLLGAGVLLGQVDAGYARERTSDGQHCLRWPVAAPQRSAVTFVQSAAGDFRLGPGLFDAVSRSETTWGSQAQACGSLDLLEGPHSPSRLTGYDRTGPNENLILIRVADCVAYVSPGDPCRTDDSCGNKYNCWDHGVATLALTLLTFDSQGRLLDADIEVNGAFSYLSIVDSPPCPPGQITHSCVGNDVQNTVTHELGHALGLAHSPDPASTMFDVAPLGQTSKRVLDPASKQFVCDVYPPGQPALDCFTGDAGPDGSGGTGGTGGGPSTGGGPGSSAVAHTAQGCSSTAAGAPLLTALLGLVLAAGRIREGASHARTRLGAPSA
jgi:matrixin